MALEKLIDKFPSGRVTPPPSKSISHRAVICGALAKGNSIIKNLEVSQDIAATLEAVAFWGASCQMDAGTLEMSGGILSGGGRIDCGESGSTLRFLIPFAATTGLETIFTGRGRLMERPMEVYEKLFAGSGVDYGRTAAGIRVKGKLTGGLYMLPGDVSSQFITGLMLALPLLERDSEIRLTSPLQSRGYVDLTIAAMRAFGVVAEECGYSYFIGGNQRYSPADVTVEADYSQAAFFLAAGALGRNITCHGLSPNSLQGDKEILHVLEQMGCDILWDGNEVTVRAKELRGITVDARNIPDIIPPIAAVACFCRGTTEIVGAGRLRFKESDRLSALARELKNLGACVEENADSLKIIGSPTLPGGTADAHNDHRIAMAVAVASIGCRGPVRLTGWESVAKSYPDFWDVFEREGVIRE